MKKVTAKKLGGLSTPKVIIPVAVVLAILHAIIIIVILIINSSSSHQSQIMSSYGKYINEATSLQAGSSFLSETSSNYVLMPIVDETGGPNVGPLISYTEELGRPTRRGSYINEDFLGYDVGEDIKGYVGTAAAAADKMMAAQIHAVALVRSVNAPLPDIPALSKLPQYTLTEEELALSDEERSNKAFKLLYGSEYAENKQAVSQNVSAAIAALQAEMGRKSSEQLGNIAQARQTLWIVTVSVIVILLSAFVFFLTQLINPLSSFARGIGSGKKINEKKGMSEVRLLVSTYNDLVEKKDTLEKALRVAAETDVLTGLPNRFSLENRFLTKNVESGYSAAVFFFDINYLKIVNDRFGHSAGDKLLVNAAKTISACFLKEGENNCFRAGGDEFVAVLIGCNEKEIKEILVSFEKEQKINNVSIAVGYSFTPDIGATSFSELFADADKKMYVEKIAMHDRE